MTVWNFPLRFNSYKKIKMHESAYPEVEEGTLDIIGVLIKLFLGLKQLLLPTTSEHAIVAGELTRLY